MSLSPAHRDNLLRWTPDRQGGFYESHFIKVNLLEEKAAFWWKFTVTQPLEGMGPARFEVWVAFFDVSDPSQSCAARHTFPGTETSIQRDKLRCLYGENLLEHDRSHGEIQGPNHFSWDIRWDVKDTGFRHFPKDWMYEGGFPKTKALTPSIDTRFFGEATVNGRTFDLTGRPGMQGHNWGLKHAESWVWTHCNAFEGADSVVFESVSSRINVGPVSSPTLTILHVQDDTGEPLTVNGWLEMVRVTSELDGLCWRFRGHQGARGIQGVFQAPAERFVGLNYADPDGRLTHCLNSKVADGELRILHKHHGNWRLHRSFSSRASAALEIGIKDQTHGVHIHVE